MQRRNFLRMVGAASLAPAGLDSSARAADASAAATVLYDDRSVGLDRVGRDSKRAADALWVRKRDLPRINDFELNLQGACRADRAASAGLTSLRQGFGGPP